jgi:hypothetical protein
MSPDELTEQEPDHLMQRMLSHVNPDGLKLIGGLLALVAGLLVLGLIAAGAFIADPSHAGTIATAAFGVIGPIVAAYFGVKIGSDGTQKAIDGAQKATEAHQKEAAKVQVMAAHLPEGKAEDVLREAGLLAG